MTIVFAKAEVICSNCGRKIVLQNYTYGEPCRFCGYKRTEMVRAIEDIVNEDDREKCRQVAQPDEKCKICTNEFVCHRIHEDERIFESIYVARARRSVI